MLKRACLGILSEVDLGFIDFWKNLLRENYDVGTIERILFEIH